MFAANSSRRVCSALRPLCTPAETTLMFIASPLRLRRRVLLSHVLPGMRWQGLATPVVASWCSDSLQTACMNLPTARADGSLELGSERNFIYNPSAG